MVVVADAAVFAGGDIPAVDDLGDPDDDTSLFVALRGHIPQFRKLPLYLS